jgi:hypothetical protein
MTLGLFRNVDRRWQHGDNSNGWRLFLALRYNLQLMSWKRTIKLGERDEARERGLGGPKMTWADPTKLSEREIELELSEIAKKIRQAIDSGAQFGELSTRLFRLNAEQRFRKKRSGA